LNISSRKKKPLEILNFAQIDNYFDNEDMNDNFINDYVDMVVEAISNVLVGAVIYIAGFIEKIVFKVINAQNVYFQSIVAQQFILD
jgi:hypothetical protein